MGKLHQFAKQLRKNSTETEAFLWSYLRNKRFHGLKFRRQEPVDKYIVDFICYEKNLIIECDGSQHHQQYFYDQQRTEVFESLGYRVIRFWDSEIWDNIEGVLEVVYQAIL